MHCHPNKTTGLMVLSGEAEVSFLNNTLSVTSGMKVMIRKGLFHSTTSCAAEGTWLMEIETPVDKHDLVRFRDSYGREGKPYEDQTHEIPKEDSCIWLEDPPLNSSLSYNLSNRATLQTIHITDIFKRWSADRLRYQCGRRRGCCYEQGHKEINECF